MMRGLVLLPVLAAACSPPGGSNGSAARGPEPVVTVTVVSGGGADCAIRWNGGLVSPEVLRRNGQAAASAHFERLDREVQLALRRGVHIETDQDRGPVVHLEAERRIPFSCFGPALRALERGGLSGVMLKLAGEQAPVQRVEFALTLPGPPRRHSAIIQLAAAGRMTWNGEATDLSGLRQRIHAMNTQARDDVVFAPSPDTDFVAVYVAARAVEQENQMPTLSACAGSMGPVRDPPVC